VRFATTTVNGDTGLWFVPTAEVLARGKWSASGYRVGLNYREGFTNVSDVPVTFGYGVSNKAELFGSFKVVTRIDRDLRPALQQRPEGRRRRRALPTRQAGMERQPGRRPDARREVQPHVGS
jgi:hypothetical protein